MVCTEYVCRCVFVCVGMGVTERVCVCACVCVCVCVAKILIRQITRGLDNECGSCMKGCVVCGM